MNENDLKDVLAEICEEEKAELNKFPPFKPSLRHRLAMKRIFCMFEKKTHVPASDPPKAPVPESKHFRLSAKHIILFAAIIFLMLFTGFVIIYFSKNFYGTVYNDNTHLFAVDKENCPATIEYEYYLPELPDGFEMVKHDDSLSFYVYTLYENKFGQVITLTQSTKEMFDAHYSTERHDFEEIEINGHGGLCMDLSDNEHFGAIVVWDNGDYILELYGNLSKNELIFLAENAEFLEN